LPHDTRPLVRRPMAAAGFDQASGARVRLLVIPPSSAVRDQSQIGRGERESGRRAGMPRVQRETLVERVVLCAVAREPGHRPARNRQERGGAPDRARARRLPSQVSRRAVFGPVGSALHSYGFEHGSAGIRAALRAGWRVSILPARGAASLISMYRLPFICSLRANSTLLFTASRNFLTACFFQPISCFGRSSSRQQTACACNARAGIPLSAFKTR
jgi:hypothetical protein